MNYKIFESENPNVLKFVFEKENDIAVEAVLYKYPTYKERTVICCSTQCGCPIGCSFCGTGKFFIRNLTYQEIIEQVEKVLSTIDCEVSEIKKLQIMFMSMGEPFLNYKNLELAIRELNILYPNAQLLVSTSAPLAIHNHFLDFIELSKSIDKVGLQFSLHETTYEKRLKIIPSGSSPEGIAYLGELWAEQVGRKPYFNYCVHNNNSSEEDIQNIHKHFNPNVWEVTLSVICEKDKEKQPHIEEQLELINSFNQKLLNLGYSTRVFNPAGQEDSGSGCGQLWYFQEWLNKRKKTIKLY